MRRRALLTTVASAGLAGCLGWTDRTDRGDGGEDEEIPDPTPTLSRAPLEPGSFETFESLAAWDTFGSEVSIDDGGSVVGSQSVRFDAGNEKGRVGISLDLSRPVDCSNVFPGLAVAADDIVSPTVQLFDTGGDRIDFGQPIKGGLSLQRYNFGIETVDGDPDLSRIGRIQIALWTAAGQERTVWIDDLHFVPRPETGKVLIQFDDGNETEYTEAFPRLEEYGYPAVSFVNPKYVDRGEVGGVARLDVAQMEALQDAGWCIANHTNSHARLTELSDARREAEVRGGKEWLLEHGFERGARYFAYPFGAFDDATLEAVSEHHDLAFWGGSSVIGYATNALLVPRLSEPTADEARLALDRTAARRGVTSLHYHDLEGESLSAFEAMVSRLHEHGSRGKLDVVLPGDVERDLLF